MRQNGLSGDNSVAQLVANMFHRVKRLVPMVLVAVATGTAAADTGTPIDTRSLVEVHTLAALPRDVTSVLGRQKAGAQGIADVREKFNPTDVVDSRLPMRRFVVGGASSTSALVAYEQGGHSHSIHAVAFSLGRAGWSQVGEWTLTEYPYTLRAVLEVVDSKNYPKAVSWKKISLRSGRMHETRPARRDGPLRELNLSDIEVREIQSVVVRILPGSILNISGVVTGCPCEEGPGCADQVWIVAHQAGKTLGLQLSRINGQWAVGVVQQWWLDGEKLEQWWSDSAKRQGARSYSDYMAYDKARQALYDRFPVCTTDPTGLPAVSTSQKPP
jgi:hypothetical protein